MMTFNDKKKLYGDKRIAVGGHGAPEDCVDDADEDLAFENIFGKGIPYP